jgi:hypothetical protein
MTQRLILASNNAGKLKEFAMAAARPRSVSTLHPQGEFKGVPEAEEPFGTFVENALQKARHAARLTGLPALADDSGVCVNALGGAPGVYLGALCRRAEVGRAQQRKADRRPGRAGRQIGLLLLRAGLRAPCRRPAAGDRRRRLARRDRRHPARRQRLRLRPVLPDPGAGQDRGRAHASEKNACRTAARPCARW